MKTVFLSASIPDPKRDPRFFETADVVTIADAVHALCTVVLLEDRLVFGGHPAITPIVQRVASVLERSHNVEIYQSEFFVGRFPPETESFDNIIITRPGEGRDDSLAIMRDAMLQRCPDAGIFIGGMEGVIHEWTLLRDRFPHAGAWPVTTTGAAARIIFEDPEFARDHRFDERLRRDMIYARLFRHILAGP